MKYSLYSGCLLRRVFEVELKMSSFLDQRNVPRGEIVIQIGGCRKRERKERKRKKAQPVFSTYVLYIT